MIWNLPDIFYFNPTCEYAVANGNKFWQPNQLLQKMEADLSALPLFMAKPKDIVLIKKELPAEYIESLQKAGHELPHFQHINKVAQDEQFQLLPKNKLMPWGWSPAAHHLLAPLKPSCSKEFHGSPVADWKPEHRQIYSKKFARNILQNILNKVHSEILLPPGLMTEICTTQQDFERLLKKWKKLMVKAPWSSSGRGLQPVTKTPVHPKVWEKLLGIVKDQGFAIAEPFLDKILDMAWQFEVVNGKVQFIGTSYFSADKKGQYQKNYINGLPENAEPALQQFVEKAKQLLVPALQKEIENSLITRFYEGVLGVDTLIFRDENHQLRINPCLEINVRQNMGLLSLKLSRFLPAGKKAEFRLFYQRGKSFQLFADEMGKKHPLHFAGRVIESGFFPLTPITGDAAFGAYLLV